MKGVSHGSVGQQPFKEHFYQSLRFLNRDPRRKMAELLESLTSEL